MIADHKSFAQQKLLGSIKNALAFFTRKGENSADFAKQNQASECNSMKFKLFYFARVPIKLVCKLQGLLDLRP